MNKEKDFSLATFMGGLFIIIGIVGMFIIASSFDRATYNELNDSSYLLEEEEFQLQVLEDERSSTWTLALGTLIINVAIGTVLITLGKIVRVLEDIRDKDKHSITNAKASQ